MKLHLLFIVIICLCQVNSYAQKSAIGPFSKQRAGTSISTATFPTNQSVQPELSAQDLEKMAQGPKQVAEEDLTIGKVTPGRQKITKPKATTTTPYIGRADTKLARASKPTTSVSDKKVKSTEEQIADIEQEIDDISNTYDPEKDLRIQKLEKLLEKKKLEKFSQD